jgi:hypothetical protein
MACYEMNKSNLMEVHHLEDVGFTLAKKIGVILSF